MKLPLTCCACALSLSALGGLSSGAHAAELDSESLRQRLAELKTQREQRMLDNADELYQAVKRAAGGRRDALDFYHDAVLKLRFSGLSRENTELRDWRISNDEQHEDRDYREALRLHLEYLALSIRRAKNPGDMSVIDDLRRFAARILDLDEDILDQPWLKTPVNNSEIAKAYSIASLLPAGGRARDGEPGWELVPGNADGMFEKTILPYLRDQRDPRIIEYWDNRSARLREQAGETELTHHAEALRTRQLPVVYWKRAQDMLLLGRRREAIAEMLLVLEKFPVHSRFDAWLQRLETIADSLETPAPEERNPPPENQPDSEAAETPVELGHSTD